MKQIYLLFLVLFAFSITSFSQEDRLWDFEDWEAVPSGPVGTNENWRGGGAGSTVALVTEFPIGTEEFNFSSKVLEISVPSDGGGVVFEGISPAFDRTVHNAVSVLVYAPGTTRWEFEMMNSGSGNKAPIGRFESTVVEDWTEIIFEVPATVAADLTKFVLKPRASSAWGSFYIDNVKFFNFVKPAPTAITISNDENLIVGKVAALQLEFTPQEEGGLVDQDATFESSNPSVASVNEITGAVTALAVGEAIITVTSKSDVNISATTTFKVTESDAKNTYTAYDFETNPWVPTHSNYTCEIVDNPSSKGINTSSKVMSMKSNGGAWQWMNWNDSHAVDNVDSMTFKIYSDSTIEAFNLEFGVGAGNLTIPSLDSGVWTTITIPLRNYKGSDQGIYTFTKDKWNKGTVYLDDIMFIAGGGSSYMSVTGVELTGGSISVVGGTLTLSSTVSPSDASNKELLWSIVSSDPDTVDVATIDKYTGEISALTNGTVTVKVTTRDLAFSAEASVVITNQSTGVDQINLGAISLFPNPASDIVFISDYRSLNSLRIYDFVGKNVLNSKINSNQIDISSLAKGIYLVELISNNNSTTVKKLVVE